MKSIKYLSIILIILVVGLLGLIYHYETHTFNKPNFEKDIKKVNIEDYKDEALTIAEGYSFFITHSPSIKDNYMYVDFVSLCDDNTYLKLRIFQGENIIGETGLIKSSERIEKVKISSELEKKDFVFLIMSYEKDTYLSLGEVKLKVKVGN